MNRPALALSVLAVIGVVFVGLGFANQREFQFAAIHEAEKQIKRTFVERGEKLSELGKPDYSLGKIEIMAKTDKAEYTVTLFVTNPDWVTLTALNHFVAPTVTIHSMDERQ